MPDGESIKVGIERLHLEQDAGKSLHDQHPTMSFVDLNRSGVALMEIVSKPDLRSAEEAKAYVAKLRTILRYLGTCDGDMEKGSLRADVNVSVRRPRRAARHPLRDQERQLDPLHRPGDRATRRAGRSKSSRTAAQIEQETRLFDPDKGETRSMRSKEEAHDYRYFPDPDLLPLELTPAFVEDAQGAVCRNCRTRRRRASCATTAFPPMTPTCWSPSGTTPEFFEQVAERAATPRPRPTG